MQIKFEYFGLQDTSCLTKVTKMKIIHETVFKQRLVYWSTFEFRSLSLWVLCCCECGVFLVFCLFVRLFCNIAPESLGTSEEDGASTRSSSLPQWQLSRNARQETKSDISKVSYAVGTHSVICFSKSTIYLFLVFRSV